MRKMLVSDYDGTYYLNDDDVINNNMLINKFMKNNIFVFATGRSIMDFDKKVKTYNLKYDYAIINHGATIMDKNNNTIFTCIINNSIINHLLNDLELDKANNYFLCNIDSSRCSIKSKNITKINVKYNSNDEVVNVINLLKIKYNNDVNVYRISGNSIEIISNKTNKLKAIKKVVEMEKIDNIYTIGDGYSDIEMIKEYNGYCMKNSVNDLLECCSNVVSSESDLIKKII